MPYFKRGLVGEGEEVMAVSPRGAGVDGEARKAAVDAEQWRWLAELDGEGSLGDAR